MPGQPTPAAAWLEAGTVLQSIHIAPYLRALGVACSGGGPGLVGAGPARPDEAMAQPALEYLVVSGACGVFGGENHIHLLNWLLDRIDTSRLTRLTLICNAGRARGDFPDLSSLKALRSLSLLGLESGTARILKQNPAAIIPLRETISIFFSNLAPLQSLQLVGMMEFDYLISILEMHSSTLTELALRVEDTDENEAGIGSISAALRPEQILRLAQICPNLTDLALYVKRTMFNDAEIATYRALGTFKYLRNLQVGWEFSSYWLEKALFETEEDAFPDFQFICGHQRRGLYLMTDARIRGILRNSAVDESLAVSIWKIIASENADPKLHSLGILPSEATREPHTNSYGALAEYTRVTAIPVRIIRTGTVSQYDYVELRPRPTRVEFFKEREVFSIFKKRATLARQRMQDIWTGLWPPVRRSGNPWSGWKSVSEWPGRHSSA